MKQFYFSILLIFGFTFLSIAQNTVTVDASATQNGYANVFETPTNGGGFAFGQPWGVPDLKTVVDASANTLTLQPNFNTWGDGTDSFWVDQTTGLGNKIFEGNTYVEDNTLLGSQLTFEGSVSSYTNNSDYQVLAFIKVFNADYSFLKQVNFEITTTGNFSVSYTNVEAADAVVQYGFQVTGLNANPANETVLGSVVVGEPIVPDLVELPVDFESATANYNVIGFGNVDVAVEANPDPSGINTSNTVVRSTKTVGAEFWGGAEMALDAVIDFSASESISIKTWSPKADIPVRLKLEDGTGWFHELDVNTTVTNEWETLTWDFSGQTAGVDWLTVVIFFEFVEGLPGDGTTYYYDDIELADNPLSISDTILSTVVSFPNPVKTLWNVQAQETITDIVIYNLFGQKILSISPNMSDVSLNMSEMRTGVYLAHVHSDKGTKIIKILKE